MTRRAKQRREPELLDPTVTVAGRHYVRIDGEWLVESRIAGRWVNAHTAGAARPSDLLDHIYESEAA